MAGIIQSYAEGSYRRHAGRSFACNTIEEFL